MSHSTYVAPPPTPAEILGRLSSRIAQGIENAKNGVGYGASYSVESHFATRVNFFDKGSSGIKDVDGPTIESFVGNGKASEIMDFSYILKQVVNYPSEAEEKLKELLGRIDERPVYTQQTREELNRLVSQINEYIVDPNMDVDDVITMIEDRVNIYIENESMSHELTIEELQQNYLVLINMLGREDSMPSLDEISYDVLEGYVERLKEQAFAVEQRVFTAEIMQEVMESLGLSVEEFAVLDGAMEGEVYGFEDDPAMKVFVAYQNGSFVFEPVVDAESMDEKMSRSDDETAVVMEELEKPCSLHKRIIEEANKRGLSIYLSSEEPPTPQSVATFSDLSDRKKIVSSGSEESEKKTKSEEARKRRYVDTSQKLRAIE